VTALFDLPARAELGRRLPRLLAGIAGLGVGLALMVDARLGLGPWEVLHQGISRHTGIPIGTTGIIVGFCVLVGWIPLRQRIGVGTVVNMVGVGLLIDGTLALLPHLSSLGWRVLALGAGVVLVGLGSGLYIGAGLGPGPRDGLMTGVSARRGHSLRLVRTALELSALGAGWLLGGTIGVGTVLFAVAIGPVVQLTIHRLTLPTLTAPGE
jgi:uncharacterized membrane protein YczE